MIDKLKYHLNRKENKKLLENFFSLTAIQMVSMILPLFTLPYVLRVIGLSNYGTIAIATSLVGYFTSITDFSFMITATRDVSIFRHSPKKLNLIYSKVMTVKSVFLCLSFLVIALIVMVYPPFYEEWVIFFFCSSVLLGNVLFPDWFFQGIEEMKYISILKVCTQVLFTLSIFLLINEKRDYWLYPLLVSGGVIISGLVSQFILITKYKLKFKLLPLKVITKTISENTPIFVNQFLPTLYNNTSTFLLGFFVNPNMVGVYAAIRKIIDLAVVLLKIISKVFFPFLNKKKSAFKFYRKMILTLTIVGVSFILIFNQIIFWYLNVEHPYAFSVLLFLSVSVIGISIYDIYGLNYLVVRRLDKMVMKNTMITSLVGFILGFPLIYFLGIIGAAINLMISRFILGFGIYFKYKKYKNENIEQSTLSSVIAKTN